MAKETQVQQEPQQVTTKEPQRVTTKDPKKVEVGKRLAAHNRKRRELKAQNEVTSRGVRQYYGIGFSCAFSAGAVIAVGVIGGLGYYIYRTKQPLNTQLSNPPHHPPKQPSPKVNKFEMD